MSIYPAPTQFLTIYNSKEFTSFSSTLTLSQANSLYAKLFGNNTLYGYQTFNSPITTALSGSNNYYFNTFGTPTTTGSTLGNTATLYIAGASGGGAQNDSINIASGSLRITGGVIKMGVLLAESSITGTFQTITSNAPTSLVDKINNSTICTTNSTGLAVSGKCSSTTLQINGGTVINQVLTGTASVGVVGATFGVQTVAITFSPAFSGGTPNIIGQIQTSVSGSGNLNALIISFGSVSTGGATLFATNTYTGATSGTTTISWYAWN